jgi:hypothetical protein
MNCDEIVHTLSALAQLEITKTADRLAIYVPAIGDSVHLVADEVRRARRIVGPAGETAVEMVVGDERDVRPLILTAEDVVYAPASPDVMLDSTIQWNITNAPPLVTYSEMERDAEKVAFACERPGPINLDSLGASLLLTRCFIAGAVRFGLRPLRAVAWWQRGWRAVGDDIPLPPFRPDASWNEMTEEAARIPL